LENEGAQFSPLADVQQDMIIEEEKKEELTFA